MWDRRASIWLFYPFSKHHLVFGADGEKFISYRAWLQSSSSHFMLFLDIIMILFNIVAI